MPSKLEEETKTGGGEGKVQGKQLYILRVCAKLLPFTYNSL